MCWLFHNWSKWEPYVETGIEIPGILAPKNVQGKQFRYTENRQKRFCLDCGYTQDEKIDK